ncbi:MAG: 50S ribosomal protein L3 [Oligoflexia bacterium]|nr:50S ribosomal protein L3 [Oligoflexia bacterium]
MDQQREHVALTQGLGGILGVKAGMTQVYTEAGDSVAVTVIDLKPAIITQVKTMEKDGYQAVQIGFMPKKAKSATKAEQGHAKAVGEAGFYRSQEFRLAPTDKLDGLTAGKILSAEFLKPGDFVDLTAVSKGKGFQGGMKRHHFHGGNKTHGASVNHRSLGSIGNRADPGRVFKNKKMAGQMGNIRKTVQNVRVVRVDMENQLLLVHGSVPGPRSGLVTVRRAVKKFGK